MELIFIFAEIFFEILLIYFLQVVEIVGAFRVDTLMEDEVLPFFFCYESFPAVRAAQGKLLCKAVLIRRKGCIADLAFELSGLAVITVKIGLWSAAGRTGAVFWNVTFLAA